MTTPFILVTSNDNSNPATEWYRLRKNEKFEATFKSNVEYDNPYDPDVVELWGYFLRPDGITDKVPGFWYEGYERSLYNNAEILTPNGQRCWKLRYTPRQAGEYGYYAELRDKKEGVTYRYPNKGNTTIIVVPSDKKGFLKVSPADPAYLVYDDLSPYWGIGHNLMGWEWAGTDNMRSTYEYDEWFSEFRKNRANMTNFSFCEGHNLEWTYHASETPYSYEWNGLINYNQQNAWKMDYRIQRAEEEGIFFRLTLLHWEDFDTEIENFAHMGWSRNPYNIVNGGPNIDVSGYFSDSISRELTKKYLRYIIARYGYSRELLAYEFFDEVDYPTIVWGEGKSYETAREIVTFWHKEMSEYIKANCINNHLVTTSYVHPYNEDQVWNLPTIDFSTFHRYTFFNGDYGQTMYEIPRSYSEISSDRFVSTGKPVLAGEYALSPGGNIQRDFDPNGVAFHTQLWVSLMSKTLGTAMHWTWGSYLHEYDLYYHYKPLAIFTSNEDFQGSMTFNNFDDTSAKVLYMGLCAKDRAWVWATDPKHDFVNIMDGYDPQQIKDGIIIIDGLNKGEYSVVFYDTYSGNKIELQNTLVDESCALKLAIPGFFKDIAIKIIPASEAVEWISVDIPNKQNSSATIDLGDRILLKSGGAGIYGSEEQFRRANGLGDYSGEDDFRFVYREKSGDYEITTKLNSLTYQGEYIQAGLMIRESEYAKARFIFLCGTPSGKVGFIKRVETDAAVEFTPWINMASGEGIYLKLIKQGDAVAAYVTDAGKEWQYVGEASVLRWDNNLLAGAAASATNPHVPITYVTAEFINLKISP